MHKFKEKITLNPVMTLIILIGAVILLSGILSLLGIGANYDKIDVKTGEVVATSENVTSMLSLSGLKYIFTSTVSNFTSFTPLSSLNYLVCWSEEEFNNYINWYRYHGKEWFLTNSLYHHD